MRKSFSSGWYPYAELPTLCYSYDMYRDVEEKLAAKRGDLYTGEFICGLPIGLELPSGITIGESA